MRLDKNKFEKLLLQKEMTVNNLAKASGVSAGSIHRIRHTLEARPDTVGKMAKALGVGLVDIIPDEDIPEGYGRKAITLITISEVLEKMCWEYCKYKHMYIFKEIHENVADWICDGCPLKKLAGGNNE